MLKAYKYALYPTKEQKALLEQYFGCVRFVYNLGLETKIASWTSAKVHLTCIDLNKQLKELKDTNAPWLHDCVAQSLQMALRNLDNAYTGFFKGKGFPKFKKKNARQSIQFPQNVKIDATQIHLPKLKWVNFAQHRTIGKGIIKTATVSKTSTGKYFVSILVDNQNELPKKKPINEETATGIDVGIKSFATLSDGISFENPKYLSQSLRLLRIEQRKLNRRFNKGATSQSNRYQKQRLIVAKIHEHIKNQRHDYLHKVSSKIIRSFDTICVEDLNIRGLMKNSNLSSAIGELGWYEFKMMLTYKAEWYGKNIIYIGQFYPSSKMCSRCGKINNDLKLIHRHWICSKCNTEHDRDQNAAINIKNFGLRAQPSTANADL